jgi:monoterpene epsilon-lactone hydrolase
MKAIQFEQYGPPDVLADFTAPQLGAQVSLAPTEISAALRAAAALHVEGVLGSPETSLSLTAHLVSRSRSRAFSLDCRLAPEHPFPAAIHDAHVSRC